MIKTPEPLTETPRSPVTADKADLLSDVLSHVRLAGAMFLRGEYSAPWSLDSPDAADLVALLAPGAERVGQIYLITTSREAKGPAIRLLVAELINCLAEK